MARNEESLAAHPPRPTINLPPRPSVEAFFNGEATASPGPMTLVSNFFDSEYPSFSQLLAGAMASPLALGGRPALFPDNSSKETALPDVVNKNSGFRQSRPMNLAVARSPLLTIPPGLSPSGFLNSPGFFSPQSPFGMSHQQALAHVTAQAALAQSHVHMQVDQLAAVSAPAEPLTCQPSFSPSVSSEQHLAPSTSDITKAKMEPSEITLEDNNYQPASIAVDNSSDDGYVWRKYGQKQVKGNEHSRGYYKCTHLKCPVKKKIERSHDGQITEIIYKGQHNHEAPQNNKHIKDSGVLNGNVNIRAKPKVNSQKSSESIPAHLVAERDVRSTQEVLVQLHRSSDTEEAGDAVIKEDNEPNPKRRNTEVGASGLPLSRTTVTESKIIVQTRSEVDLLDDGYRWRKYGQKVVKGNPYPRSYYKCTSAGCNVRKHVERASVDPKAVITTYEGKHNHNLPAARNSSHIQVSSNAMALKPEKGVPEKHPLLKDMDFGNNNEKPVFLRLTEDKITV